MWRTIKTYFYFRLWSFVLRAIVLDKQLREDLKLEPEMMSYFTRFFEAREKELIAKNQRV